MSLKKLISDFARYNHWANEEMIRWLKTLDRKLLYLEAASSFKSIDLTIQHMIHAQNFWYAVMTQADLTKLDETIKSNAAEGNMNELQEVSQKMLSVFTAYSDEELFKQVSTGEMLQCRYDYILHMVNHNSYHRGQIVTMSRGFGVIDNIPTTDYDIYLWTQLNSARNVE